MLDPGDGASDSERKGNDGLSVKGGESHQSSRLAVLGDLLLIWDPSLQYSGDFDKVHPGLRLLLIAACPCGYLLMETSSRTWVATRSLGLE